MSLYRVKTYKAEIFRPKLITLRCLSNLTGQAGFTPVKFASLLFFEKFNPDEINGLRISLGRQGEQDQQDFFPFFNFPASGS